MTKTPWTSGLTVKSGEAIHIKAPDGSNVAQMTFLTRTGRRDATEVLATAKLFAQAPAMAELLEEVHQMLTAPPHIVREMQAIAPLGSGVIPKIEAILQRIHGEDDE